MTELADPAELQLVCFVEWAVCQKAVCPVGQPVTVEQEPNEEVFAVFAQQYFEESKKRVQEKTA
jgi:hypothetical protein